MIIKVDVDDARRALPRVPGQIAFAAAQAVNDVAFIARDTERNRVQSAFTIRRDWVLQGIQVARPFATKQSPTAVVEVEPHRSFLDKFEPGTIKKPRAGGHLAVPDERGLDTSKVIPKGKRPKAFEFKVHTTASGKRQVKGSQRTFILDTTRGEAIFQRTGRGKSSDIRLLYWLPTSARIQPALRFEATVRTIVERSFHEQFGERLAAALRTAR